MNIGDANNLTYLPLAERFVAVGHGHTFERAWGPYWYKTRLLGSPESYVWVTPDSIAKERKMSEFNADSSQNSLEDVLDTTKSQIRRIDELIKAHVVQGLPVPVYLSARKLELICYHNSAMEGIKNHAVNVQLVVDDIERCSVEDSETWVKALLVALIQAIQHGPDPEKGLQFAIKNLKAEI